MATKAKAKPPAHIHRIVPPTLELPWIPDGYTFAWVEVFRREDDERYTAWGFDRHWKPDAEPNLSMQLGWVTNCILCDLGWNQARIEIVIRKGSYQKRMAYDGMSRQWSEPREDFSTYFRHVDPIDPETDDEHDQGDPVAVTPVESVSAFAEAL